MANSHNCLARLCWRLWHTRQRLCAAGVDGYSDADTQSDGGRRTTDRNAYGHRNTDALIDSYSDSDGGRRTTDRNANDHCNPDAVIDRYSYSDRDRYSDRDHR